MGVRLLGTRAAAGSALAAAPAGAAGDRPGRAGPRPELHLLTRHLDVPPGALRLDARLLGPGPPGLVLGAPDVPLDARRLRVRARLLGLSAGAARRAVRAGVFPTARVGAGLVLPAGV